MEKIVYMLSYIMHEVDVEIRLNDMHVASSRSCQMGRGQSFLNSCIPFSGEQQLYFNASPLDGKEQIENDAHLLIDICYVCVDTETQSIQKYQNVLSINLTGKDIYSGYKYFKAEVPYNLNLGQQSLDISQLTDINGKIYNLYHKWNSLIDQKKYDEILSMLSLHDYNEITCHYWKLTDEEKKLREDDFIDILANGYKLVIPTPEDHIIFYGYGRLVRHVHPDGTPAFVLRNSAMEEYPMDIYLHLPKNSIELQII